MSLRLFFTLLLTNLSLSFAQENTLKVFLDCSSCDKSFIKTELTFVNYVRERREADVHILITRAATGSGGSSYTINFLGQKDFANMEDTLTVTTSPDDTEESARQLLARTIKIGLVRFAAKTDLAQQISVTFVPHETSTDTAKDRWNNWVFTTNLNGYHSGEQLRNNLSLSGSFSADRVTQEWKTSLGLSQNYNESNFKIDGTKITSINKSKSASAFVARGLSEHWSLGIIGSAWSSTYSNIDLAWKTTSAIEYDIFPYSQFTRRELRLQYGVKRENYQYIQETIFDKTKESLWAQGLEATLGLKQKWGSIRVSLGGEHYLKDFKKNFLVLSGDLSLRLFRGLSLTLSTNASRIHNQLSLPKAGATTEEVLLQQRQLTTQYSYYSSVGISYTFGSIYSNIVNPRFGN